jgi:hypothetical protein
MFPSNALLFLIGRYPKNSREKPSKLRHTIQLKVEFLSGMHNDIKLVPL